MFSTRPTFCLLAYLLVYSPLFFTFFSQDILCTDFGGHSEFAAELAASFYAFDFRVFRHGTSSALNSLLSLHPLWQYIKCILAVKTLLTPQSNITFRFSECNYQKTVEKRESLVCHQHEGLCESTCALDPSR